MSLKFVPKGSADSNSGVNDGLAPNTRQAIT